MSIAPLPPRPDLPAGSAGHRPGGDPAAPEAGFADLLASLLASAIVEDGRSGPAAVSPPALRTAEMFNETGFFGEAVAPKSGEAAPDAEAAERSETARGAGPPAAAKSGAVPAAPKLPADSEAAPVQRIERAAPSAGRAFEPVSAAGRSAANPAAGARAVAPSFAPASAAATVRQAEAAPWGRSGGRAAPIPDHAGGSLDAFVGLQLAEGEISLNARLEKLSREQRERLREEIVQLLARHGFAAGEIRLNGEAKPAR